MTHRFGHLRMNAQSLSMSCSNRAGYGSRTDSPSFAFSSLAMNKSFTIHASISGSLERGSTPWAVELRQGRTELGERRAWE
eukprot:13064053-Alexandrium_andersonii.AAC.1